MKKILLALIPMLAIGFIANAQFTYNIGADTAYYGLQADNVGHKAKFQITNNSSMIDTLEYRLISVDTPSGWFTPGLCDWRTCYLLNDFSLHKIDLQGNATNELYIDMKRPTGNTVQGCSDIVFEFNQKGQPAQRIHLRHTDGTDLNCWPTSTNDLSKLNLVDIYPNPTTNIINLNIHNKNIKTVQLSNLIGKQIQRVNVSNSNGSIHQLSLQAMPKGIYILQFKNDAGKILGVSRITKQ